MDNDLTSSQAQIAPYAPASDAVYDPDSIRPGDSPSGDNSKRVVIVAVVIAVVILAALIAAVWVLAQPTTDTAKVRDIFIIFMALQSLLLGLALIVLIIQLARLTNLLQNEIKPILDSTNETVSTLRGTTNFLSDNLVEPVIKLNEYLAGFSQLISVLGLSKKPRRKSSPKGE